MRRIQDTFTLKGAKQIYTAPIDRLIPEPSDVKQALPYHAAILAIELMACPESYIRHHLRIGSTPPTKMPLKPSYRQKIIQNAIFRTFGECVICEEEV